MKATIRTLAIGVVLVMLAGPTSAQQTNVDDEARKIYRELMSPYCPGQSLYSCQSSSAAVLRGEIRQRLAAGESREAIVASLVAEFGESILGAPPNRGFNRAAWLGPIVMIVVGGLIIVMFLRRHTRKRRRNDPPEVDPAMRKRLEKELDTYYAR